MQTRRSAEPEDSALALANAARQMREFISDRINRQLDFVLRNAQHPEWRDIFNWACGPARAQGWNNESWRLAFNDFPLAVRNVADANASTAISRWRADSIPMTERRESRPSRICCKG